MSTIFNLLCPICTEVFHNNDDIHSTSCGHVLHYRCMQEWFGRSTSCPQCRSPNPTTYKLYLSFDESAEAAANFNELKVALGESQQQVSGLKDDIVVKEEEIKSLQEKQDELSSQYEDSSRLQRMESEAQKENIARLEETNLDLSHKIERLSMELETLKSCSDATIAELKNEIAVAQSKVMPASDFSADTTITELKNEIKKLTSDLDNSSILLAEEVSKNANLSVESMKLKLKPSTSKEDSAEKDSSQLIFFREKNKVLEQKLKHITSEFQKEINKSTQLEIDNMKLQNYVDCMKMNTSPMNNAHERKGPLSNIRNMPKSPFASSNESINSRKGSNCDFNNTTQLVMDNMKLQNYEHSMKMNTSPMNNAQGRKFPPPNMRNMRKSPFGSSTESMNSRKGGNRDFIDSSSNSIVILKHPTVHLLYPLENSVVLIAHNIGIEMTKTDIDKVNIVNGKGNMTRELVTLFVRFKTKEMKYKFLVNKSLLIGCPLPHLRTVHIKEYIDDRAQNLLAYANMRLKSSGFNHIFLTNNQIFAKQNQSDPRGIRILSRQQVDDIVKNAEKQEMSSLYSESDDPFNFEFM